jgi:hypothetical protein
LARRFVKKHMNATRMKREKTIVPKLLVLFEADTTAAVAVAAAALAEAAATGARGVRFMEVDIRTLGGQAERFRQLESTASATEYDGILFVAPKLEGSPAITGMLTELAALADTSHTVFAAVGAGAPTLLAQSVAHAGIFATIRPTGDDASNAGATGAKAAKLVGWVRHALGHEAEHQAHTHDHSHEHKH